MKKEKEEEEKSPQDLIDVIAIKKGFVSVKNAKVEEEEVKF